MTEITLRQRKLAAHIIVSLRGYYKPGHIAEMIGINRNYVTWAASMQLRPDGEEYLCPKKAIDLILKWGFQEAVMEVA